MLKTQLEATKNRIRNQIEDLQSQIDLGEKTPEVKIEVDEDLQWFSYGWTTEDFGTFYNLSDVIATFVEIGNQDV